ncbi:MAG TPA: histidine kinase [Streptosporangiaceae bacterium]|jgi:signal transduction histidine kinase
MFRSLAARWGPAAVTSAIDLPLAQLVVQVLLLVMVLVTVPLAQPRLGAGAHGTAVAVALGVCAVSWAGWLATRRRPRLMIVTLAVMGVAGGALVGLSPLSTAITVGCVATSAAGARLDTELSLAIAAGTIASFLAAGLATGAAAETLLGYPLAFAGLWAFGLTRHSYLSRAEQAERMLAETRRAREAETQAAALGERARIAREIHDVLAHSLAAVSVNLQAAEALLGGLPDSPELAKAVGCIGRAGAFTREGLADARRAILALRGDAPPLPDQLSALAGEYRTDGGTVEFTVTGPPRPVPAEAGLAAYRTAQEALTNARKHAPGQPVSLALEFLDGEMTVRVANPLPAAGGGTPLAATGAGYGLAGLRERAVLGGGTLTSGPAGGQWQVCLRIPA